jgi:hypothetical protein
MGTNDFDHSNPYTTYPYNHYWEYSLRDNPQLVNTHTGIPSQHPNEPKEYLDQPGGEASWRGRDQ